MQCSLNLYLRKLTLVDDLISNLHGLRGNMIMQHGKIWLNQVLSWATRLFTASTDCKTKPVNVLAYRWDLCQNDYGRFYLKLYLGNMSYHADDPNKTKFGCEGNLKPCQWL